MASTANPRFSIPLGLPPWIVVMPAFPLHMNRDDTDFVLDDQTLTPKERTAIIFFHAFEAVKRHNDSGSSPIYRLGCSLAEFGVPASVGYKEQKEELKGILYASRLHLKINNKAVQF